MTATRLADGESIDVDGRLDEAVWSRAIPAGDFIQIDPNNGQPATERTEVRIAFDSDALYLGVTAYDSEPDTIIGKQRRRDEALCSDDKIRWTIDTFLDARTGYFFEMNPEGAMADALMGNTGQNRAWDGVWTGRARRSEIGWTLEVELPFRTFNFNPNSDTWGFNIERTVHRNNEVSIWMGWVRNQGLQRMANAGLHHRHPRRDAGTRPRHQALWPVQRNRVAGPGQVRLRSRRQRRHRSLLQPVAHRSHEPDREYGLRAGRGRSAPGEPHPLFPVLSRSAAISSSTAPRSSTSSATRHRRTSAVAAATR